MFFFSSRRRHTRSKRDWSSDVCSSDLRAHPRTQGAATPPVLPPGAVDELIACVLERVDAEAQLRATAREQLERALRELRAAWAATWRRWGPASRSEEHTSELQSRFDLVCRLLLE